MNLNTASLQIDGANELLKRMNVPVRLSLLRQHKRGRVTIELGTLEQIKNGTRATLFANITLADASKFLTGFSSCLNTLIAYKCMSIEVTPRTLAEIKEAIKNSDLGISKLPGNKK